MFIKVTTTHNKGSTYQWIQETYVNILRIESFTFVKGMGVINIIGSEDAVFCDSEKWDEVKRTILEKNKN
jgi:hypothetical protein